MPDGDIIHPTLNRRFLNVYGQICEGHWESSILGYRLLHPLKGQIQNYGNVPVSLGNNIVPILEDAISNAETRGHFSFADCSYQIMEMSKNPVLNGSPTRGRDLMVEAAKKTLVEIQHKKIMSNDVEHTLFRNYVDTVYKKDFEERIQETPVHHKDAHHTIVNDMMEDIRPHVNRGRDEFVNQLVKYKDVKKLRRHQRLKEPPPTINDEAW
ncbi:MAG: hypothetical protein KDE48_16875 [Anaerolineales bacterium]|nr:hypothetical protein [Anaerolineales bacterium]